jgi:hypothetical protein
MKLIRATELGTELTEIGTELAKVDTNWTMLEIKTNPQVIGK